MSEESSCCQTCGSVNFNLSDGIYFCVQCHTQFEEIHTVSQDDFRSSGTQVKVPTSKPLVQTNRVELDYETQWTTNEAFNIILKKLVDKLIEMGADPLLKETILRLWILFLQKTQFAFCKKEQETNEWVPKIPVLPRERDEQIILEGRKMIIARKYRKNYLKSIRNKTRQDTRSKKQKLRHASAIKKQRVVASLNPQSPEENMDTSDQPLQKPKPAASVKKSVPMTHRSVASKKSRAVIDRRRLVPATKRNSVSLKSVGHIGRMTIERVVDFLYLGLLLVHEKVLLCDLIGWIESSKLPVKECVQLLPERMKFQTSDNMMFRLLAPSHTGIRQNTAKLSKFLGVHSLPRKSLREIVARFVLAFNLPGEINQLVKDLIKLDPPRLPHPDISKKHVSPIPNFEGRAIAYIIVVLKLLFGLDGKTEKKQSKFTRKISKILKDENFFDWCDWVSYTKERLELHQRSNLLKNLDTLENFNDVDQIVNYYINVGDKQRGRKTEFSKYRFVYVQDHKRDQMRAPLRNLIPELENICSSKNDFTTDYAEYPEDESYHNFTLRHISNPHHIKEELHNLEISVEVRNSSAWSKPNTSSTREKSYVVYQPSFEYSITRGWRSDFSLYTYLVATKLAPSLVWLLDMCSEISHVPAKTIFAEVLLIERHLIQQTSRSQSKKGAVMNYLYKQSVW